VYFFFRLPERKRYQKERARATSTVLLRYCHAQTGLELATLRQIAPYLRLTISPPDAPTPMPEGCAVECCAIFPHSHRMVSRPHCRGVKRRKYFRSSPGSAALIFSLVSFFCIKAKESTIGYFFFFFRLPPKNKYINLHDITFSSIFAQF